MCLMNRMLRTSLPSTLMFSQLQRWLVGSKLERKRWERSTDLIYWQFSAQYFDKQTRIFCTCCPRFLLLFFFLTLIVSSAPGGSRSSGAEERTSGHLLHCLFSFLLPSGCHWDAGLFYQRMSPTSNFASMMRSNSWTLLVSWCLFSSFDFLFFQTSTAGLLHISVFLALTLPALLVTSIPNTFLFEQFVSCQLVFKCETGAGEQGACNCSLVGVLWRLFGRPWWPLHIQVKTLSYV